MNTTKNWILFLTAIFAICALTTLFLQLYNNNPTTNNTDAALKMLNQQIKTKDSIINAIENNANTMKMKIDSLTIIIAKTESQIKQMNKSYEKKKEDLAALSDSSSVMYFMQYIHAQQQQ